MPPTLALSVARHGAETLCRAETDRPDVVDMDGDAAAVCDHDTFDVFQARNHAFGTDVIGAVHLFDVAAARVLIIAVEGFIYVADRNAERIERIGIDRHFVLLEVTAETVDLDNARNARQLSFDDPVLNRAKLHRIVSLLASGRHVERILVYFTQSGRNGHHFGHAQFGWNFAGHGLNLLVDELPRIEDRHALLEYDRHHRQTETRHRADLLHMHDVAHGDLDREGDKLLDLLRRQRGRHGDDLNLVVGDVGHGIDRQGQHRIHPAGKQTKGGQADENFFRNGKADYGMEHRIGSCDSVSKIIRMRVPCDRKKSNRLF